MKALTLSAIAAAMPALAMAQEAAEKVAPPVQGQHFGLSDEVWLWLFMGTAVVFTMIILTVNSAIRNLAESKNLWKPKAASLILLLLASRVGFAQDAGMDAAEEARFIFSDSAFWAMAAANIFLMFYALLQLRLLSSVTKKVAGLDAVDPVMTPLKEGPSWFSRFWMRINDLKSIEHEKDLLLNHNYDGIHELDNNLPPWWKWTFYISIIFGVVYLTHYHILKTGALPKEELALKTAEAEAEVAAFIARAKMNVDETSVVYLLEDERLTAGASIFKANCAVCHGQSLEGGVGPNLTDTHWLHGGSINDVFKVVKYGVPAKGMQAWNTNLTAIQIQNVSTYILSMQGTNPANAKEPQGDHVDPAVPQGAEQAPAAEPAPATEAPAETPGTAQNETNSDLTVSVK